MSEEWEYRILKDEDGYKLVEYYIGLESWAEIDSADTLEELEKQLTDDFVHQIIAIRRFNEDMSDM